MCGVLGLLAPVHWCARLVHCYVCSVSWATPLLFSGVPARCVVCPVPCPGPSGFCSPVCLLDALPCAFGVLGHSASVHPCACSVGCIPCAVSLATSLLFTSVHTCCLVSRVRCPGLPGSCSPVCPLRALRCLCGVLSHFAPVHRCARSVWFVACAVSWAIWLLFTAVHTRCVVSRVPCPGPPGSCSLVCPLGALRCLCGVLGQLAPVHRSARSVRCVVCSVSWAILAPVHWCSRSVRCVVCWVSWVTWLPLTGLPARCIMLRVRCPRPLGSRRPDRSLGVVCRVCGGVGHLAAAHRCARMVCSAWSVCSVLGHLAPVLRCARSVNCVACAVSLATWLRFTGARARFAVLCVRGFPVGRALVHLEGGLP